MVAIAEIEGFREAEGADDLRGVAFVGKNGFAEREIEGIFFVVAGADEISSGAFAQQFGDGSAGEDGSVIEVRRDEGEDFTGARRVGRGAFDGGVGRRGGGLSRLGSAGGQGAG